MNSNQLIQFIYFDLGLEFNRIYNSEGVNSIINALEVLQAFHASVEGLLLFSFIHSALQLFQPLSTPVISTGNRSCNFEFVAYLRNCNVLKNVQNPKISVRFHHFVCLHSWEIEEMDNASQPSSCPPSSSLADESLLESAIMRFHDSLLESISYGDLIDHIESKGFPKELIWDTYLRLYPQKPSRKVLNLRESSKLERKRGRSSSNSPVFLKKNQGGCRAKTLLDCA